MCWSPASCTKSPHDLLPRATSKWSWAQKGSGEQADKEIYRAADWNLEQPVWQGRLRVKGEGLTKLFVQLEDPASSRVFATCRVDPDKMSETLEPVLDSSRYYVLRIEDEATQRHAFIGMGFHERDQSFEFKAALQDFQRRVQNERDLATRSKQDLPKLNLTLKEGETITVDLKTGPSHFEDEDDEDGGDDFGFLPPPPTGNKKISSMSTKNKSRAQRSPAAPRRFTPFEFNAISFLLTRLPFFFPSPFAHA